MEGAADITEHCRDREGTSRKGKVKNSQALGKQTRSPETRLGHDLGLSGTQ